MEARLNRATEEADPAAQAEENDFLSNDDESNDESSGSNSDSSEVFDLVK